MLSSPSCSILLRKEGGDGEFISPASNSWCTLSLDRRAIFHSLVGMTREQSKCQVRAGPWLGASHAADVGTAETRKKEVVFRLMCRGKRIPQMVIKKIK